MEALRPLPKGQQLDSLVAFQGIREAVTSTDWEIRTAAFASLERTLHPKHRTLSWEQMKEGFQFQGRRWPFVSPQGIFTPMGMDLPLSILTAPIQEHAARKYADALSPDGLLVYKYRGTDPGHRDNVGLRNCISAGTPLIYFFGLVKGLYEAIWPVRVLSDDPSNLQFLMSIEEGLASEPESSGVSDPLLAQKSYRTRAVCQRLHQDSFRRRVLAAYATRCTICSLRHEELLEAAHIIPDSDPRGLPVVQNGMAMCNLHHGAFDTGVIGIRPNLVIDVRRDILEEEDGPMLVHGLQGFDGRTAAVPRSANLRPNPEFLAVRYEQFRRTA